MLESTNPTPGFGDHQSAILSDIYYHPKRQKPVQRKVYNWTRANVDQLKSDIETGTKSLLDKNNINTPINDIWLQFKDILMRAQEKNVPSKSTSRRFNQKFEV